MFELGLKQLIENCKINNTKAQGELYKLFSGKLFAICLKYSRNYAEAEDNLQDALLKIFNIVNELNIIDDVLFVYYLFYDKEKANYELRKELAIRPSRTFIPQD